jgi:hypothetical protein
MKKVGIIAAFAAVACLLPCLTGCGGQSESVGSDGGSNTTSKTAKFSFWLGTIDQGYYTDYSQNPVINYLTNYKKWGPNKDTEVSFDFQTPAAGSQVSSINTIVGSGDYPDIIDTSYYKQIGTVDDLYNQGAILDLTDYVTTYMPNYIAWLDAHPFYKKFATSKINGEAKYLEIYNVNDSADAWGGFCYRRDWLVKYGKNPVTGAAFTGSYDANGVWTDNIVFPSKGSDPINISDWEWMFGIFKEALAGEGITDGYVMNYPYQGFFGTGDLASSFNSFQDWTLDREKKTYSFGGKQDSYRQYLEVLAKWYKNGWLNPKFYENTSDMFFNGDTKHVNSGRVGMWYGGNGVLNNGMDISDGKPNSAENGYTNGICVYGARQPINDEYGTDAEKNKVPYLFYHDGLLSASTVITKSAKDKDIPALLSYFDYMYSEEGAATAYFGLSKDQYEECKDPLYTKNGITEGAYTWCDEDGNPWVEGTSTGTKMGKLCDAFSKDSNLWAALKNNRVTVRAFGPAKRIRAEAAVKVHSINEWNEYFDDDVYPLLLLVNNKLSGDDASTYSRAYANVSGFYAKSFPGIIMGSRDISNDTVWNNFVSQLNKYKVDDVTAILQNLYDSL